MSDLLVTDWSGIAHEFSYTTLKPSLFIDTPMKVLNTEYIRYKNQPLDITLRNQIGLSIKPEEIEKAGKVAEELLAERTKYSEQIQKVRDKYVFSIGHSGEKGAKYILQRLLAKKAHNACS
jgi:YidC/Oxa1 family membrane protein insertase